MALIYFQKKIPLSLAEVPDQGGYVIGFDTDGILKQKDFQGNITQLSDGESSDNFIVSDTNNKIFLTDSGFEYDSLKYDSVNNYLSFTGTQSSNLSTTPDSFSLAFDENGSLYSNVNNTWDKYATQEYIENLPSDLKGTKYLYVQANGTPIENATELQNVYNEAKTLLPTVDNRIVVICGGGIYKFPNTFVMDTPYIDLVSLTGNRDVIFDLDLTENEIFGIDQSTYEITNFTYALSVEADNIYVRGIKGIEKDNANWDNWWGTKLSLSINVNTNLPNVTFENCLGGVFSWAIVSYYGEVDIVDKEINGTFINCEAPNPYTFGTSCVASGTFTNCILKDSDGFGSYGVVSGKFDNCVCELSASFGTVGIASGTFTNCKSGASSFGSYGVASGTFIDCKGGSNSFGSFGDASGTFIDCKGGSNSFGSFGDASGTFKNCVLTNGVFKTLTENGEIINSIDGSGQTVNIYSTNNINFRNIPGSQFGTPSATLTSDITQDLTVAKRGQVQKIYHNATVTPTFPSSWVNVGNIIYTPNTLNIIYVEYVSDILQEYRIETESLKSGKLDGSVAEALTPEDGDTVYITTTSNTFTDIGFWGYESNNWVKLNTSSNTNTSTEIKVDQSGQIIELDIESGNFFNFTGFGAQSQVESLSSGTASSPIIEFYNSTDYDILIKHEGVVNSGIITNKFKLKNDVDHLLKIGHSVRFKWLTNDGTDETSERYALRWVPLDYNSLIEVT